MNIKRFVSYMLMCTWAGYTYIVIELVVRQKTDISMMFCASICVLPMIFLNNIFTYDFDFLAQICISALYCTAIELWFGILFNSDHHIWDYSNMILNYKGQICLPFYFVWVGLSTPIILFMDWVEYNIFKDCEQPYYKIFGKEIYRMKSTM